MGIYFSKIRTLLEVKRKIDGQEEDLDEDKENNEPEDTEQEDNQDNTEDNGDDEHQADNSASDYSMDVEEEPEEEQEGDGEQEEEPSTDSDTETTEGEEENDTDNSTSDYSMDVEDDGTEDSSEDVGAEETGDDNSDSDDSVDDSDSGDEGSEELKSLENDIFQDITPEQMNIKILELKKQYLEVYSTIVDVLTRTNKIPKTTQNIKVLEFIINKLMELKDLVQFYLSNTFDTKTYMENMVNYQQYLVTLNTINRLLKEINVKKGK